MPHIRGCERKKHIPPELDAAFISTSSFLPGLWEEASPNKVNASRETTAQY